MTGTSIRVWVDGALVDPLGPAVSALDHAVTVGDGVFETVKIVDDDEDVAAGALAELTSGVGEDGLDGTDLPGTGERDDVLGIRRRLEPDDRRALVAGPRHHREATTGRRSGLGPGEHDGRQ